MNLANSTPPSPDPILAMIRGELSPTRRWLYRSILVVTSIVAAVILALWVTEPKPLPLRLHLSFAAMTSIAAGWISILTWILIRRNCPTALDRLATAWMALAACSIFLVVSLTIALVRESTDAVLYLGSLGFIQVGIALFMLKSAYSLRSTLRAKLAEMNASGR